MQQNIIDPVCTEDYSYTGNIRHTKYSSQIIISSSATDTTDLHFIGFHLYDRTRIIIQSPGKRNIKFNESRYRICIKVIKELTYLVDPLNPRFRSSKVLLEQGQFPGCISLHPENRIKFYKRRCGDSFRKQLLFHFINANFFELINGNSDIYYLFPFTYNFGNTSEDLPVIELNGDIKLKLIENFINGLDNFILI